MKSITGLIIAFRTLTSLPMPEPGDEDLALSLPWFPLVGFLMGAGLFAVGYLWELLPIPDWPGGVALILLSLEITVTRGLHLDGLADWADSLGVMSQREKRLAVMKDVQVGAFGAIALLVVLMFKWVSLERILAKDALLWLPLVFIMPKTGMVELISTLPYARIEKGTAGPFVKGALPRHRFLAHMLTLFLCLFFGPFGILCYVLSFLAVTLYRGYCRRMFGGITGDLLGTANELMETGLLFILALFADYLQPNPGWQWLF